MGRHLSTLQEGTVLNGTFRIQRLLAEGGMGMVYVATHERMSGRFVVKTVHPKFSKFNKVAAARAAATQGTPTDAVVSDGTTRLWREAELLASLSHQNIVKVFDVNQTEDGMAYFVMEHLEGRTLNEIAESRTVHPWQVVAIVDALASGLTAAHALQIFHRDLKPENVLVVPVPGQGDVIKLIDFGVSNFCLDANHGASESLNIGTPNYMSPEQLTGGSGEVDARSDQFSLAVMTYELICGKQPFARESDTDEVGLLERIVNEPAPPMAGKLSFTPRATEAVLQRGMEKRPDARFATIAEFAKALSEAIRVDMGEAEASSTAVFEASVASTGGARRDPPPWRVNREKRRPLARRGSSGVKTRPIRLVRPRRRRRYLRALGVSALIVASAVLVGTLVLGGPWAARRSLWSGAGRGFADRFRGQAANQPPAQNQTNATGPNNTVAAPGIRQPFSSESGSAHPLPP